jgi:hypothetical protein
MTRKQAMIIAELINGSFMANTDTPDEIPTLCGREYEKVMRAQKQIGEAMLRKHGVSRPVSMAEAVSVAYGGAKP